MNLPVPAFRVSRLCNVAMFFVLPPSFTSSAFAMGGARRVLPRVEVVGGVKFDGPVPLTVDVEENEVVFEHCVTRTLPPALTLEDGLQKMKDAVEMLKLEPPRRSIGFLRFQVAVPPSPKALSWFCCQPESSGVFPLIFLSKNTDNPTCKSLYVNGSRGVFGIGAAVSFAHSSPGNQSFIKRYISTDSTHIVAYGFMDINSDDDLVSMSHEDGSFCFFIPQIELDELESVSILTMTLAWDDFSFSTFKEALHLLEVSLNQVICHVCSATDTWKSKCTRAALRKLNLVQDRSIPKV
ncbi:protein PHYLLO, chloroplastic-like [Gastrolobium bilobum]|uniref:protein PHYLLO, chloroplastic-like n=1 Tax=Gastrolobium bilobum TaxID=150636 RepID=UPI002AB0873B|nr:protein PHYLLO, chloroplastic-like [Gastrolobium bilobum]